MADLGIADGRVVEIDDPNLHGDAGARCHRAARAARASSILHTHYDPQVLWDPELTPSSYQGVTSVVAGNCGFSLAPCPAEMRASMLRTLDGVEDMRVDTLHAGIEWSFETHPEYLDRVASRGTAVNFGGYVGHTAVRLAVMGAGRLRARGRHRRARRPCARVVIEALRGGAVGFSSDRSGFHRADGGHPVPSAVATQDELEDAHDAPPATPGAASCTARPVRQFHWLYDFQPRLGRPITWSAIITYPRETRARAWWGDKIAYHLEHCVAVSTCTRKSRRRPVSFRISMREPSPFYMVPAFARVKAAAPDRRVDVYADDEWRAEARAELDGGKFVDPRWDNFAVAETATDASERGTRGRGRLRPSAAQHPLDVVLDLAIADIEARFSVTFANDDLDGVSTLLTTRRLRARPVRRRRAREPDLRRAAAAPTSSAAGSVIATSCRSRPACGV